MATYVQRWVRAKLQAFDGVLWALVDNDSGGLSGWVISYTGAVWQAYRCRPDPDPGHNLASSGDLVGVYGTRPQAMAAVMAALTPPLMPLRGHGACPND